MESYAARAVAAKVQACSNTFPLAQTNATKFHSVPSSITYSTVTISTSMVVAADDPALAPAISDRFLELLITLELGSSPSASSSSCADGIQPGSLRHNPGCPISSFRQ